MQVSFHTFGCKVNQYETQVLSRRFAAAGHLVLPDDTGCDVAVVNSCTVTAEGDRKTRQLLRRLRREHPDAVLVLTGCYPQAFPDKAAALDADVITGARNRAGILAAVERFLATGDKQVDILPHLPGEAFESMKTDAFSGHTRAFVKVQDGCENFCAYCIIPFARGPLRSKDPAALRAELQELAAAGYREVVLSGINLTAYARERGGSFLEALYAARGIPGLDRIRLGSMEPDTISPADIREMAALGFVCPHFHLSLQSGCDTTLRRMGRKYDTAAYLRVLAAFREHFPGAAITTDMMVGFPGETDEDFAASEAFAVKAGFAKIHVFSYSPRAGTAAAAMPDQISGAVKRVRSASLIRTAARLRRDFLSGMTGTVQQVLIEERGKDGQTGYTPNYTPVTLRSDADLTSQILPVRITGLSADGDGCLGETDLPQPLRQDRADFPIAPSDIPQRGDA